MAGEVSNVSFDKFVERAYVGIPNSTSTIEEKERAIAAKKKILAHPSCPESSKATLRPVNKWFTLDINRDRHWSNVETKLGDHRMWGDSDTYTGLDASMSNEQLAKLYNMQESIEDLNGMQLEKWLSGWLEDLKNEAKDRYNIELNDKQIIILKNEYKK